MIRIARWLAICGALAVALMMFHIGADIAMKYLFNHPLYGTLEISSFYYMIPVVFLPLAYSSLDNGQIKLELFTKLLPERPLRIYDGFIDLLLSAFLFLLTWQSAVEAVRRTAMGETKETAVDLLAIWPSRWVLPIGLGMAALFHLLKGVGAIRRRPTDGE